MSQCAPPRTLSAAELAAERRRVLAWQLDRIDAGGGVVSCTGLPSAVEVALYAYLMDPSPPALARVYAAAEHLAG